MSIQSDFIFSCEFSASEQWRIILHVLDMQLLRARTAACIVALIVVTQ